MNILKMFAAAGAAASLVCDAAADPSSSTSAQPAAAQAALTLSESSYVSISPCVAFDTSQPNAGGPITSQRAFVISGTAGFGVQGGQSGGCGVPTWATAVSLSLTPAAASVNGQIVATPYGAPIPATVALSYGPNVRTTASLVLGLGQNRIILRSISSSTQVAGAVNGYFVPPIQAQINQDGTIKAATARVVSASRTGIGQYTVTANAEIDRCAAQITPFHNGNIAISPIGAGPAPNTVVVRVGNWAGGTFTFVDDSFNFVVRC